MAKRCEAAITPRRRMTLVATAVQLFRIDDALQHLEQLMASGTGTLPPQLVGRLRAAPANTDQERAAQQVPATAEDLAP